MKLIDDLPAVDDHQLCPCGEDTSNWKTEIGQLPTVANSSAQKVAIGGPKSR